MSLFLSYASIIIAITAKSFLALFVQEHEVWTSTWFLATAQIRNMASSCDQPTNPDKELGGSLDREHITMASGGSAGYQHQDSSRSRCSTVHGHQCGLRLQLRPQTSAQHSAVTMDSNRCRCGPLQQRRPRHYLGLRGQRRSLTSI